MPPIPPVPPAVPGNADPRPPLVPVSPAPATPDAKPPLPLPPVGPIGPSVTPGTTPALPGVGSDNTLSPGYSTHPTFNTPSALPGKVTQLVTLEASCPETVVFGSEFRYELIVKNTGTSAVGGVRVEDELPAGAKFVGSDPPAEVNGDRIGWAVGNLDANTEKRITVRLKPADEGEVRSRATVTYTAAVEARTKVTRPRLAVTVTGTEVCKSGDETIFQIKVTNTGTGPAEKMVVQALLSDGLSHSQGYKLEMPEVTLAAGESKMVPLRVGAAKAGMQVCQVMVAAQGSPDASAKATVNVVEPRLQVTQTGPAKCLVRGSEPVYEITLTNAGTAATDPITLYAYLPDGFDYVQSSDNAGYSTADRVVIWKLAGLNPGGSKAFSLKMRGSVAGDGILRTIARAMPEQPAPGAVGAGGIPARPTGRMLEAKAESTIRAEGVAAVRFEVIDLDDPVEVGKEAIYEIRVTNQGTGACTNVQLVAAMAEGTAYTGSSGPTQVKTQGQNLIFDPIANLAVKGEAVYRVKVRGSVSGDLRFRVQLTCDQVRTPVVKEESTRFYKE